MLCRSAQYVIVNGTAVVIVVRELKDERSRSPATLLNEIFRQETSESKFTVVRAELYCKSHNAR
jgi:hypothetical protein